jgi:YidC/Oxa1 family membrane protein insertase
MGSEQRNALVAIVLSGLILFGWQTYFAPQKNAEHAPVGPEVVKTDQPAQPNGAIAPATTGQAAPIEPSGTTEEFTFKGSGVTITFDNTLSVKNIENPQTAFNFKNTVDSGEPMKLEFDMGNGFQSLSFSLMETENKFYNAAYDVTAIVVLNDKGAANFNITSPRPFKFRFVFKSIAKKLENTQERFFSFYTDELDHFSIGEAESGDKSIKWAGIDFNYHLFANYFEKPQDLLFQNSADGSFSLYTNKTTNQLGFNLVFVKKEYNYLTSLGHNLNQSVDFGIWGFFAVWILKGLQFFYKFIPNYGVSIILLTLLVRLITFPLQYKSFVSMKKLQLIQPELTKIREKFKDDPQKMQKESMELFRKSGANPIGGCLPLLLQMPVFFAFYKVLHSAVELVDAPFMLWIQDLSNKDPFYVLPVLMTLAMFLQQKMTPNTITDPVQKKVMLFMPLIFGVIMKDLPSGLSLYIFVSTVFGILQQMLVFNSKSSKPVVV